ncbi:hypothetical protein GLOIN_2v1786804 [Rhizophagus irregularis DAOM 181602=DAOM 197198]|uniref:Uncharacterized protein n=1 Tax=Rhizophagus irregularis (strain DAOM 181602 / DAOM 197198 / MUCL 43194) TaxID=747089 RepID=A0A2P4P7D9_RHIID|nr:hypothetical protein GLOIN_2v1786804 [Rhizophagus irregularis DAOM 181602=DAOM 197198]POG61294.1 hypothetical protein GLOIN_2v1786804 [Rhizophagus irregularis DAOM 181602=DAOM 197198]|eukprot:XP_025168160.1 hypothetical protein GLOIN_2v1786804 [Rhizophagus irregularis DAOM 181602=DAOM 197198]
MPVQLSTILIFQNIGRKHQCFILLTKKNKPCYVPKLEEGQVLSIANSKFAIGPVDNQIDLILTTATILPINVVGTASVSDLVLTTNLGIQFECTGKDKPTEIPITLFHPNESCLKSQTTMKMPWSSTSSSSSPHMIATRSAIHKKIEQSAPISTLIVTEEIQVREEQEESASILITPATIPATTPPSKKRVGHAKV